SPFQHVGFPPVVLQKEAALGCLANGTSKSLHHVARPLYVRIHSGNHMRQDWTPVPYPAIVLHHKSTALPSAGTIGPLAPKAGEHPSHCWLPSRPPGRFCLA